MSGSTRCIESSYLEELDDDINGALRREVTRIASRRQSLNSSSHNEVFCTDSWVSLVVFRMPSSCPTGKLGEVVRLDQEVVLRIASALEESDKTLEVSVRRLPYKNQH
jgi:hypothetical protein